MNKKSIKSFWNNGFDEGCDKEKLIQVAKDDINQLLNQIEKLEKTLTNITQVPRNWEESFNNAFPTCQKLAHEALKSIKE